MKIALPSHGSEIDGHFGHCQAFTIFEVDGANQIIAQETLTPPPGCGCKSNIIPQLAQIGVTVMLAGNMGGGAVNILNEFGIEVVRGCSGNVREVTQAWLAGRVADTGTCCEHHSGECEGHS